MIPKNVGGLDRLVRAVVGVALAAAGIAGGLGYLPFGDLSGAVLTAVGAGLLFSAVTGRCVANRLLGVNTCRRSEADPAGGD